MITSVLLVPRSPTPSSLPPPLWNFSISLITRLFSNVGQAYSYRPRPPTSLPPPSLPSEIVEFYFPGPNQLDHPRGLRPWATAPVPPLGISFCADFPPPLSFSRLTPPFPSLSFYPPPLLPPGVPTFCFLFLFLYPFRLHFPSTFLVQAVQIVAMCLFLPPKYKFFFDSPPCLQFPVCLAYFFFLHSPNPSSLLP